MTMGKSAGSAPPPPDPNVTAAAQTKSNVETAEANARLNRVNQFTPQGSSVWSKAPQTPSAPWDEAAYLAANPDVRDNIAIGHGTTGQDHYNKFGRAEGRGGVAAGYTGPQQDQWEQTVRLSPEQQRLYDQTVQGQTMYGDAALQQLGGLKGMLSQPVNFDGAPGRGQVTAPTLTQDAWAPIDPNIGYGAESRGRVEAALAERLAPMQGAQRAQTETQLRNQGLVPGTEAWTNAMNDLGRQENDARLGIIAAGGQEEALQAGIAGQLFGQKAANRDQLFNAQQALFGQQTTGFNQQNATRDQAIKEQLMQRQIPLNEIAALLGGQQVQYPQFGGTPQVQQQTTDVTGAYGLAQQGQQANYTARAQQAASANAGTAGLVGSLATAAVIF